MPRGPVRPWRELAPHTKQAIPYVNAAMRYGYDVELPITEVTADEWENFRRGLFNAAKHLGVSLHCHPKKQADGSYTLIYAVHKKNAGRRHILEKHGTDRAAWPYNPRRRTPKE